MNKSEFEQLKKIKDLPEPIISGDTLTRKKDRTLLYGYTCDRRTFHVYIKDISIHVITYGVDYSAGIKQPKAVDIEEIKVTSNKDYIPDKRLYPETCDYEFCKRLQHLGYQLPFTTWTDNRPESPFYGMILE